MCCIYGNRASETVLGESCYSIVVAGQLERLMLFYVLPALLAFLLFTSLRAWRRQHHKRDLP